MVSKIALCGPMLSGKSTVAATLEARGLTRIALADALKDDCRDLLNDWLRRHGEAEISAERFDAEKAVFRPFLQWFGTDFARRWRGNDRHWVDRFLVAVDGVIAAGGRGVVCDDVRFPNEADALRSEGFLIVRIARPEAERTAALLDRLGDRTASDAERARAFERIAGHPSETAHRDIRADIVIHNRAGLAALAAAAADLIDVQAARREPCGVR